MKIPDNILTFDGKALSTLPERIEGNELPEKFELRINEEFLMKLPFQVYSQFDALLLDFTMVAGLKYDIQETSDYKNNQKVITFRRK